MEKYYEKKYASGRGDYINIYDEDLNLVRWEKVKRDKLGGDIVPDSLQKIVKNTDPVEAFLETKPLNDDFSLVLGYLEMSREQREKFIRNVIKKGGGAEYDSLEDEEMEI